jgi:hypothetical protein
MSNRASTGAFIYGIVPADVEPTEDAVGLGDPPGRVSVVPHRDIAALISEVGMDRPLGRPEDLLAYQRLLDGTATVAPVLPVRFGAVLTHTEAVADLLAEHYDVLSGALNELEGRVEYLVRGRYVEQTLLSEVLAENGEAAGLREQIRGQPEEATMNLRIRLGEIINAAVEAKRAADTQRMVDVLAPHAVSTVVREPTHEEDAGHAAFLVAEDEEDGFRSALEDLADEWDERVTLRLRGPLAPYDFVGGVRLGV